MKSFFSNRFALTACIILILGVVLLLSFRTQKKLTPENVVQNKQENIGTIHKVIGKSVQGRSIDSYTYGNGKTNITFVGGVHGGYEWNSVVLAYEVMDYLEANPKVVPSNLTVTIIPSANPDGIYKIIGKEGRFKSSDVPKGSTIPGRFNANKVDLNRNFDCKWMPKSTWQQNVVSGGKSAFSEPESLAIKNFVQDNKPIAIIFWHSQSGSVYASKCEAGILPETINIMDLYAKASGYTAVKSFDAYETSGDAEGWLAKIGIPAITVELKTHDTIELKQNLAGVDALFKYYSSK